MKLESVWGEPWFVNCAYTGTGLIDAWSRAHNRTLPTVAVTLAVSSSSTADTAAGTGAQVVEVWGLDGNYEEIAETFILNGQTPVGGTKSFLRVNFVRVSRAGTGLTNAGVLYVFDSSDTVASGVPQTNTKIFGVVEAGAGVSQMGMRTIPANRRGKITRITGSVWHANTTAQYWRYSLAVIRKGVLYLYNLPGLSSQTGHIWVNYPGEGLVLEPKDEVILKVQASTTTQAQFSGAIYAELG